jgi:hypothetical protein
MSELIFGNNAILTQLERIATTLERIEIVLEEKENKTIDAKECRELMQDICKHYKNTEPYYDIQVGSRLHIHRFRDSIAIRKLEDKEFIARDNSDMFEILDTGKSWWDINE